MTSCQKDLTRIVSHQKRIFEKDHQPNISCDTISSCYMYKPYRFLFVSEKEVILKLSSLHCFCQCLLLPSPPSSSSSSLPPCSSSSSSPSEKLRREERRASSGRITRFVGPGDQPSGSWHLRQNFELNCVQGKGPA